MSLLDRLKRESAAALDRLLDMVHEAGVDANMSIIISHPGTVEDSILIGGHEIPELYAILQRMETGDLAQSVVTRHGERDEVITERGGGLQ